jgi:hypothetical protein
MLISALIAQSLRQRAAGAKRVYVSEGLGVPSLLACCKCYTEAATPPQVQGLPMSRWFNTTGPCRPELHYMLAPTARLPDLTRLIEQQQYAAVVVSAEVGAPFSDDPGAAELAILDAWRDDALYQLPPELHPPPWPKAQPGRRIGAALGTWCAAIPRPLVLFLDEIDALADDALLSVLRQLRDGYRRRPTHFPWSLAQLDGYLQGLGAATSWLMIFDQRRGLPPIAERTGAESATTSSGRQVTVIRA